MKKYGSDKVSDQHNYTTIYEQLFSHRRDTIKNVLEVGIGTMIPGVLSSMVGYADASVYRPGASLRGWVDYFPNAQVFGLDVQPDCMFDNESRITTMLCDTTSEDSVKGLNLPEGLFDVIVDDGLHCPVAQQQTLLNLWALLRPGGVYIIEDVMWNQTAQSPFVHGAECLNSQTQALLTQFSSFVAMPNSIDSHKQCHNSLVKVIVKPTLQ